MIKYVILSLAILFFEYFIHEYEKSNNILEIPSIICFSFEWPTCTAKDIANPASLYLKICIEI